MTVIGTDQYKIPPVVLRIISVSEININLLGVSMVRSIRETEREKIDEQFTFSSPFTTVRLESGKAATAAQLFHLILRQF